MMASNYLEAAIINYFLRGQMVEQPTNHYVALFINDPMDENTGSEVVGEGYSRQLVRFSNPTQVEGAGSTTNSNEIEFNKAINSWGRITHFGIFDRSTGGNLLVRGSFNRPETIEEGNQFIIEPGNLTITVD